MIKYIMWLIKPILILIFNLSLPTALTHCDMANEESGSNEEGYPKNFVCKPEGVFLFGFSILTFFSVSYFFPGFFGVSSLIPFMANSTDILVILDECKTLPFQATNVQLASGEKISINRLLECQELIKIHKSTVLLYVCTFGNNFVGTVILFLDYSSWPSCLSLRFDENVLKFLVDYLGLADIENADTYIPTKIPSRILAQCSHELFVDILKHHKVCKATLTSFQQYKNNPILKMTDVESPKDDNDLLLTMLKNYFIFYS